MATGWRRAYGVIPVWLVVDDGHLALLAPGQSPTGYVDVFRVPAHQAKVSSAAQRITVSAHVRRIGYGVVLSVGFALGLLLAVLVMVINFAVVA